MGRHYVVVGVLCPSAVAQSAVKSVCRGVERVVW